MIKLRSWFAHLPLLVWLAVLVLAIAFALRFFALDQFPPGVQHDEVFIANFAETILNGTYPIFFELNRGNEPLFMYMVAATFKLFGENVWVFARHGSIVRLWRAGFDLFLTRDCSKSSIRNAATTTVRILLR